MPSKRQRQLARLRAQRQEEMRRRRVQARRRRAILITASALAVFGVLAVVLLFVVVLHKSKAAAKPTDLSATPACGAVAPPAPAIQTFPAEPPVTIDTKSEYTMTLNTSCGNIIVALDAPKAPHTVNALAFLAGKHYFDGTFCPRLTGGASLSVLQCGSQTGDTSGTPGFTLAEENTKGAHYTRGTVAMAKSAAAHTTGSQFFLIDKDSMLPAQYTVVGHIVQGLDVLDQIQQLGVVDVADGTTPASDGEPSMRVYLNTVTVTKGAPASPSPSGPPPAGGTATTPGVPSGAPTQPAVP